MDHPNIARVFDAGATEKGRPFYVMEFIDGEPITSYCDRHRLNTRERLALFLPVCQALQHAHQKGILHRDIEPSNVLVATLDGKPVPKVIDFGIAKSTEQRQMEQCAFTQLGQLVGTPEYMSPEAADVMSNDVDTSSDVYSLGILLYELLIGSIPFDGKTLRRAGLVELMRIIREVEVPPMTAKLPQMGATAAEVAARRRTDLPGLKRQITGDLNWIVTKVVEKNRQRRYPAAAALLADIERHLQDRPVAAGPPSSAYKAAKFPRRHRTAVAAAIFFSLAAGGYTSYQQYRQAIHQSERATRALTLAENNRLQALNALG
ncbi:MAG: serine/threonine protein kinase [Bryobacter sp.]|jgi:non-specific serine/threonine protein kinase/serine/threonine-protein kinase|nr:serine/threonine protein kinase [Bryobacter sp. CoA8 C33]